MFFLSIWNFMYEYLAEHFLIVMFSLSSDEETFSPCQAEHFRVDSLERIESQPSMEFCFFVSFNILSNDNMGLTVRILIFVLVYWLCNVTFISEKCFRQSQWMAPVPMTILFTRAETSLQQLTRTDVIGDCSNLSLRTSRQCKFRLVAKKNRFEQWLF